MQYIIVCGRHYGLKRSVATQKRWPNEPPAAIGFGHLEVSVATDGFMPVTFEKPFQHEDPSYQQTCKPFCTETTNELHILKLIGKHVSQMFFLDVNKNAGSLWMSIFGRLIGRRCLCSAHHGRDALGMVRLIYFRKAVCCAWTDGKLRHCNRHETFLSHRCIHINCFLLSYHGNHKVETPMYA